MKREFKVGVFRHEPEGRQRKPKYAAYTVWYNPSWKGCCVHNVTAQNGAEAKRKAIAGCKDAGHDTNRNN